MVTACSNYMGKSKARSRSPKIKGDLSPQFQAALLGVSASFWKARRAAFADRSHVACINLRVLGIDTVWKATSSSESRWTHTPTFLAARTALPAVAL